MPKLLARLIASGTLFIAASALPVAAAQNDAEKSDQSKTGRIAGRLMQPEGAALPFKGFQLQAVLQRQPARPQAPPVQFKDPVAADDQGRFSFADLPPGRYVIQPVTQQNVPFVVGASAPLDVKPGQLLDNIELTVKPCREVRGRVVDCETGAGIQGVEVTVQTSEAVDRAPQRQAIAIGPRGFAGRFPLARLNVREGQTAMTDAEGSFSVWVLPSTVETFLHSVPVEYLPPPAQNVGSTFTLPDFGDNPLIELQRAATVEGIVVDEAGEAVPLARLDIERAPVLRFGSWEKPPEQTDRSGKFMVRQLDPSVAIALRARSLTGATLEPMTLVPAQRRGPVRLVVSEKYACRLSGQVVDRRGKPLPDAKLSITGKQYVPEDLPAGRPRMKLDSVVEIAQVAADGTFASDALYAGDTFDLHVTAPGHSPRQTQNIRCEAGEVHDVGRLVLDTFVSIKGVVVDAAGNAVPRAVLHVAMPAGSLQPERGVIALHCDEGGAFELPPANGEGILRIWARAGQNVTDGPASFFPDLVDGLLKIELGEQRGLRITGQVADLQGRPVQAKVAVTWQLEHQDRYSFRRGSPFGFNRVARQIQRTSLADVVVNADGSLRVEGLWPRQQYRLSVTAAGFQPFDSAYVSGTSGETIDLGRLILRRIGLAVEGQVRDASGHPVADANVYKSGDVSGELSVTTGSDGRFRVTGLLEGPITVLVRKQGYRPAGLRCAAGDTEQRVRLISVQEPRPQTRCPQVVKDVPIDRRALAMTLLNELWQRRHEYDSRSSSGYRIRGSDAGSADDDVVRRMASLDYKQALKWSAEEGGAFDEIIHIRAFDQIVHDDVGKAVGHAGAPGASVRLKTMAHRRLAVGQREDAIRLLEAALDANLKTELAYAEPSAEIMSRAQLGALAIAAGRDEWGRKLVNEAADRVEALGPEADVRMRAAVVAALASFDVPRAVRIWVLSPNPSGGISPATHAELAALVGVYDLAAARRIVTRAPKSNGFARHGRAAPPESSPAIEFEPILRQIARRLAGSNPEKALTLLDEIDDSAELEKAEIVGRAARAMAPRDPLRAYDLFDRALNMCFAPGGFGRQNPARAAALIAVMAAEAGYPDMQTIIDQVLVLRPPTGTPQEEQWPVATIEAAWLLAMIDAPTAVELLGRISPPDAAARSIDEARPIGQWLQAWVMLDIEHAVELFHQVLNKHDRSLTSDSVSFGLLPMIDALFWSRDDCLRMVLNQASPSWFPYASD